MSYSGKLYSFMFLLCIYSSYSTPKMPLSEIDFSCKHCYITTLCMSPLL